jgi:alpha-L-fucosidase 2
MLLQADGDKIILFPAWPRDWGVEFKLRAPFETIVEGRYAGGKIERLEVTPPERLRDVVGLMPQ